MKYIEPPSKPRPTRVENKSINETKQEVRDREVGNTVGILIVITSVLLCIVCVVAYNVLNNF